MVGRTALTIVCLWASGCGGAAQAGQPMPEPAPEPSAPVPERAEADAETPAAEPTLLSDLDEGDTLTYAVRRANGEELEVQLQISRVLRRGGSTAVQLSPRGATLSDTEPVYPRWVIGTHEGLFGLEPHVALTAPEFVPLDDQGQLVTEARSNVAWHVPPRWFRPAAGAFDTDTEEGWRLAGHEELVEGTVRGERCVRLERPDGSMRTQMLVCANVGMMETTAHGATAETPKSWRLVDLGGPTSPELR